MVDLTDAASILPGRRRRRRSRSWVDVWRKWEIWFSDNCIVATIVVFWVALNVGLFAQGCRYVYLGTFETDKSGSKTATALVYIGRGFGRTLLLNCALTIAPMTQLLSEALRKTWLNILLPLDENVRTHKALGYAVAVGAVGHGGCLFSVYCLRWNESGMWEGGTFGLTTTFYTGLLLVLALGAIFVGSLACIRRSNRFEFFWYSHHAFIVFYLLLIFHGNQGGQPNFIYWGAGPVILYAIDRCYRETLLSRAPLLSGSVKLFPATPAIRIELPRNRDFVFRAGQYAKISCPAVSSTEFHPFTIASAPDDETLVFYVKCIGNWTQKLYNLVEDPAASPTANLEFRVSGPFGAPTEFTFQFEDVVLIGGND